MRITVRQLPAHLRKTLAPVYLVCGDEPLQTGEALDALRRTARRQGYSEREVLDHDNTFDWGRLAGSADALSLFAERKIIDLRLSTSKIGNEGSQALVRYTNRIDDANLLLIRSPKLERSQYQAKWVKAIDRHGVVIQVWPVEAAQLVSWLERRMRDHGLEPGREVARMLAERTEGNLLAATQEIEKLLLLHGPGAIGIEQVTATADSARFDVFALSDAVLVGNAARTIRILRELEGEGTAPTLVLWALAREARTLSLMTFSMDGGASAAQVIAEQRVWEKRRPLVRKALERHSMARWRQLLSRCGRVDEIIKGVHPGDPWEALLTLATEMAGTRPLSARGR